MSRFAHLAYTPAVRSVQRAMGSGAAGERRLREPGQEAEPLTEAEADFVRSLDSFLIASVGETGWPYVQHRGGPPGFVHVLDQHTLAYLDVRGNRQYITSGNLRGEERVALFFLDHARCVRLKSLGRAETVPADERPELAARIAEPRTGGLVEQLVSIRVEGFDWNCPKHITPRFTEAQLADALAPIRLRIRRLEEENAGLRARLENRQAIEGA
jgi:predicted pyridoxine 5'-phosphate oxidase superfamily flavin-nucleotide-binding protein